MYLGAIRVGMGKFNAAKFIGMRHSQVKAYVALHPDLAEELADAEGEPVDNLYEKAYGLALAGDIEAIKFLLPKLDAERFGSKQVLEHRHVLELRDPAELEALADRARARKLELETGGVIEVVAHEVLPEGHEDGGDPAQVRHDAPHPAALTSGEPGSNDQGGDQEGSEHRSS